MKARAPLAVVLSCLLASPAGAFEPFTHNYTGDTARGDALDGSVTIDGRSYLVRAQVLQALRDWPQFYDAGVIGPDIYPDLLYGWNLIHTSDGGDVHRCETEAPLPPALRDPMPLDCTQSGDTGAWLELVLERAWAAQNDPSYTETQRAQILAFSYGFLTHAAGDLWAHTFVNDFAQQLWPPLGDVLTDPDDLKVALRHKAVEAYVGDATPHYDGNPNRTVLSDGDVSNTSTPTRRFNAPHRFLYETLIDPAADTPARPTAAGPTREMTLGFFFDLRARLVSIRSGLPDPIRPLQDLIAEHDRIQGIFAAAEETCREGDESGGLLRDAVACVQALAEIAAVELASRADFLSFRESRLRGSGLGILARYLDDWIAAIDEGLEHWGELSLALNRAYFDPQVRRDLQNETCALETPGVPDAIHGTRADCENAVGTLDVILDETNGFVNDYLLEMLGAPPIVPEVRRIRQQLRELFDQHLATLFGPALGRSTRSWKASTRSATTRASASASIWRSASASTSTISRSSRRARRTGSRWTRCRSSRR